MVLCGVCFKKSKLDFLRKIGVKDSKKLNSKSRAILANEIKSNCVCYKEIQIPPQEIDIRGKNKLTLNQLEIIKMAEIINDLKPNFIYVDAADVNEKRFGKSIKHNLNFTPEKIISKHKADDLYPIVSAASIIAKNKRDMVINEIREKYINLGFGDLGSGYPSDSKTIQFLRDWVRSFKEIPPFVRKSWETTKKIIEQELLNKKITDFF